MKVSPLSAFSMKRLGHPEAITGIITGLNTTNATFDLIRGDKTFSVLYSGISATNQPGLDSLLERAQSDHLRVRVISPDIDFMDNSIMASAIIVKAEGIVSDLTNTTFSLSYGQDGASHMVVDYSNADVEGTIADGAWYEIKLYGHSGATDAFLARKVEVQTTGIMTDD